MAQAAANPNTLGAVVSRCQSLMGDSKGNMYSRGYLVPFINQAYEELAKQLKNASGKNLEALIEIIAVSVGTSSLYSYQSDGDLTANPVVEPGPLAGLYDPIRLWVKNTGQLPQYYTEAYGPRDTLPFINPPGITAGTYAPRVTFCWMGNQLSITPVATEIDIQVYGRFDAPPLVKDTDKLVLYPRMTDVLASGTIAWTGIERSNTQILAGAESRAMAGVDNIVADIIRQVQKNPRRLAQMGGCGGCSWGWGGNT